MDGVDNTVGDLPAAIIYVYPSRKSSLKGVSVSPDMRSLSDGSNWKGTD